ncbi:hypothetical protein FHW69_000144 [Luteibacter sp. Sphag1AF]|uniref:contact-dependent growth inhibition system immunity protein n=1 Tax=Luteibacter sp. Sphag1AF TaxID=2587031 RepID=UPI00160EE81B|nr:contact-dependent growth inhibition system immunity protein [Luteibacter sp. Sphag1AF]MBB3225554.1 hypothetical protein [Luteibacter sp. Sphag1AF]
METQWAGAVDNGDFICIDTYSGNGLLGRDTEGVSEILGAGENNENLGCAVIRALAASREITLDEYSGYFNWEKRKASYTLWVNSLMQQFGYRTRKALFRNMRSCSIAVDDSSILFCPSHHEKLEAWSGDGISKDDYVVLPFDSSPADIGAALRLAFSRCT